MQRLTDREQSVIAMRFGIGISQSYTLQRIADQLGISESYVRKIEKSALRKLRKSEKLRSYWEDLCR